MQATTVLWRVIPMGFLFLVRVSVTATRWHLGSGSKEATWHYIMMEVRTPLRPHGPWVRTPHATCSVPFWTHRDWLTDTLNALWTPTVAVQ